MAIPKLICFNDFCEDIDDPFAMIVAAALQRLGLLRLSGVVVGTDPTDARTAAGRGLLDRIGLRDVPLASGRGRRDEFWFAQTPWIGRPEFQPASELLYELFGLAEPRSLTTVVMAPMSDLASFIGSHCDLFIEKTEKVVIMGGVEVRDGSPVLDKHGYLQADTAKNMYFNKAAGDYVLRTLQERGVPTTIVTRHAAFQAAIPLASFKELTHTGHEVAKWLFSGLREHFNQFWWNCHLPLYHPIRVERNMPERQNREWFINSILKGKGSERSGKDKIDDLVDSIPVYDALAIFAAVPEFLEHFYSKTLTVNGSAHQLIGIDSIDNGVVNPTALVQALLGLAEKQLRETAVEARFLPLPYRQEQGEQPTIQ